MKTGFRRFVWPWAALAAVVLAGAGAFAQQAAPRLDYPQTRKVDHVDTYHGVRGARPVPLARGRQLGRDGAVGRGRRTR